MPRDRQPILVVEDNDEDFGMLDSCLKAVGVSNKLIRCIDSEETRSFLSTVSNLSISEHPCFVFLDLNLPGTHGSEVLKDLKAHELLSVIPVVVLTTSSRSVDITQAYKNGAAGFLSKPVDLEQFERMVQQVSDYWFACVKLPGPVVTNTAS